MEFSEYNRATISETIYPRKVHFWQVGLLDVVLLEYPVYPDKSHNFRNFIFMTSHFCTRHFPQNSVNPTSKYKFVYAKVNYRNVPEIITLL